MAGLHHRMNSYVLSSIVRTESQRAEEKWALEIAMHWLEKPD